MNETDNTLKSNATADSLGRTLDNLGKDIRTVASGVDGVGDSAEVYAVRIIVNG